MTAWRRLDSALTEAVSVTITTDGSITHNPGGRGGWAFLLQWPGGRELLCSGAVDTTTNNRMEMQAILEGLRHAPPGTSPLIRSDSQWAIRGCRRQHGRQANRDQFEEFDRTCAALDLRPQFQWVRGHSGDPANERVDRAARAAAFGTLDERTSS